MRVELPRPVTRFAGVLSLVIIAIKVAPAMGIETTYKPSSDHVLWSALGVLIWLESEWYWHKRRS